MSRAVYRFRDAKRKESKAIIGLYGPSGAGKTYSALLLGRGLIGPNGALGIADSEHKRGELFSDIPELGGYKHTDIEPPFTPQTYIDCIEDAVKAGLECLVIDSLSHEWEGTGGVLEMAAANRVASGASINNWNKPKTEHNKLILAITRSPIHLILCFRAKRKTIQVGDKFVKDAFYTPKTDTEFISECLCFAEILGKDDKRGQQHSLIVGKTTHPDVAPFFKTGAIPTKHMGELFAKWSSKSLTEADLDRDRAPPPPPQKKPLPPAEDGSATKVSRADEPPTQGRLKMEDDYSDGPAWMPPEGWPVFQHLSEWGNWSKTWLRQASRIRAEGWSARYGDHLNLMRDRARKPNQGLFKELVRDVEAALATAMKRE